MKIQAKTTDRLFQSAGWIILAAGFAGLLQITFRSEALDPAGVERLRVLPLDLAFLTYLMFAFLTIFAAAIRQPQLKATTWAIAGWTASMTFSIAIFGNIPILALQEYQPLTLWILAFDPGWMVFVVFLALYDVWKRRRLPQAMQAA